MISGLYSAATAMEVASARHEVTAENLASMQLPGYRRRLLPQSTFESMMPAGASLSTGLTPGSVSSVSPGMDGASRSGQLGTAARPLVHDFTQGSLTQTNRPLDLAISGDGFFSLDGPEGTLYTRNGSFSVLADGTLVSVDRLPVRGTAGTVRLPADVSSENVQILPDGRLFAGGEMFAQLELIRFDEPFGLIPAGSSLYAATPAAGGQAADVQLQQGYLELSNVSAVTEMAEMILNSRQYDAAQRALNTIAESIQKRIGL